jgi:hypothetical protein
MGFEIMGMDKRCGLFRYLLSMLNCSMQAEPEVRAVQQVWMLAGKMTSVLGCPSNVYVKRNLKNNQ